MKLSFEKYLGIDSTQKKWRGLKIATVSFLVGMGGTAIAFGGLHRFGYLLAVLGAAGSFVGILMHWFSMFSQIAKSDK